MTSASAARLIFSRAAAGAAGSIGVVTESLHPLNPRLRERANGTNASYFGAHFGDLSV